MKRNKYVYGEEKPHWGWSLVGMMLALIALSFLGAWIAERL